MFLYLAITTTLATYFSYTFPLFFRSCRDCKDIREASDELNADPAIQDIPELLQSSLCNISTTLKSIDTQVTCVEQEGDGCLKNLDDYTNQLISQIKALREKGKKDIKDKQEKFMSVLKQHH